MFEFTLPIKADDPPNLDTPTATLAGAPPGAFLKAGASARETPPTVGTKSINNSPKQTTSELLFEDFPFVFAGRSSVPPTICSCSISQVVQTEKIKRDLSTNMSLLVLGQFIHLKTLD